MQVSMSTPRAFIELSLASIFWGFGFIGTVWALGFLSFPAVIFYRFAGAFLFGALFWAHSKPARIHLFQDLKLSWPLGLWLAVTLLLQTWGLLTTSATKSAFITVLYVIIVPVLSSLLDRHKLGWQLWGLLSVALLGTGLIVRVDLSELTMGDVLTFGNAFAAAIHIRRMGQISPKAHSQYNLNLFQCLWVAILTAPLFLLEVVKPNLFQGSWQLNDLNHLGWIGLLSLTFGSSLFAFFLQARAQKHLPAALASLLFLMESPFSAFFAAWLLKESLSSTQILGAGLIFASCLAASFLPTQRHQT